MNEFALEQFREHPDWHLVLQAYHAQELEQPIGEDSEVDVSELWGVRLPKVEGVASDQLSRIHGQLIAHGLLSFQMKDGRSGVQYRVSVLGKQALDSARQVPDVVLKPAA